MALGSLQKEKCVPLDHKGVSSSVIALLAAWVICRLWLGAAVFGLILIPFEELVTLEAETRTEEGGSIELVILY